MHIVALWKLTFHLVFISRSWQQQSHLMPLQLLLPKLGLWLVELRLTLSSASVKPRIFLIYQSVYCWCMHFGMWVWVWVSVHFTSVTMDELTWFSIGKQRTRATHGTCGDSDWGVRKLGVPIWNWELGVGSWNWELVPGTGPWFLELGVGSWKWLRLEGHECLTFDSNSFCRTSVKLHVHFFHAHVSCVKLQSGNVGRVRERERLV